MVRNEDVRRFEVAVDNSLLMRVLNGLANLDKKAEPLLGGKILLVAVFVILMPRTNSMTK